MQLVTEKKLKTFFSKKIYAIGPATGSELIKHNVKPIIASSPNSEGLAKDLDTDKNVRNLIFCGTNTRGHLQNELKNIAEALIDTFVLAGKESIRLYKEGLEIKIKEDNSIKELINFQVI